METDHDFEEESSTDEDYIPSGEESDDNLSGEEFSSGKGGKRGRSKSKKTQAKSKRKTVKSRKRKRGSKVDDDDDDEDDDDDYDDFNKADDNSDSVNESEDSNDDEVSNGNGSEKKLPEVDKKKSDSLWADFLKDVDPPAKSKSKTEQSLETKPNSVKQQSEKAAVPNKKIITEVFDFAGESVSVTKEVDADSEEVKNFESKSENKIEQPESNKSAQVGVKRSSNIGNILGKVMGKKPKMTTLDKSRLDWETFKKDENIDDEIRLHNKGKDGYLDRQAFLQRVDVRQFEVEKNIREINRSKR